MCEQAEANYLDGEVVWVKLGSCWWPGEVVAPEKLPPDVLPSFRKPPIAVVKFFQEDTYEYVKNTNAIYKYECSRKDEFINKGLYMYRTKHGQMDKFPEDVIRAENAIGGDIKILTRDEFQETKKESYAGLFGDSAKKTPASGKKGKKSRPSDATKYSTPVRRFMREKADYKVHILLQGSKTPSSEPASSDAPSTPSTSVVETEPVEEKSPVVEKPAPSFNPVASSSGIYSCHACPFTTTRLNVLILHNKTHSVTFTPYTPSPAKKKTTSKSTKTPSTKTPKERRPKKEKTEKASKESKESSPKKRSAEEPVKSEAKKSKTNEEIKSSLLADWDDGDEESNDETTAMPMAGSPEIPVAAESPAAPTPAELPSAQVPGGEMSPTEKKSHSSPPVDKPESSNDSKYEFCEDEDWPVEADAGRKIPRMKTPKRKEETKSLSLEDDEVAKEVAELLNKTTVPELPSVPEPLKVEENFPEPSIVKSPDKRDEKSPIEISSEAKPIKAIFKTKTFFRSRHSRSQDAIGKYVAEQLNAVERMDISESEINGTEVVSSPEARESPPIEHIKVARLAPKIQLKKMKAELREKERNNFEKQKDQEYTFLNTSPLNETVTKVASEKENKVVLQDVLYPTQEIKPVNTEKTDNFKPMASKTENHDSVQHESGKEDESTNEETEKEIIKETINHVENSTSIEKFPEAGIQKSYTQTVDPYMNESTASAVDALLSVSREADRVTRHISNDPPEDLFEDDNRDSGISNNVNGFGETVTVEHSSIEDDDTQEKSHVPENSELKNDVHVSNDLIEETVVILPENSDIPIDQQIDTVVVEKVSTHLPSESDLQIAEALINLPSTAIQSKTNNDHLENLNLPITLDNGQSQKEIPQTETMEVSQDKVFKSKDKAKPNKSPTKSVVVTNNDKMNVRFETEQEKCENLNAAQSLVQMSESIDHKINIVETKTSNKDLSDVSAFSINNNGTDSVVDPKKSLLQTEKVDQANIKSNKFETTSKLLKILEEPCIPKVSIGKASPAKQTVIAGKEKILNFDVAKSFKSKQAPQQKIIIRRTTSSKGVSNNVSDITTADKIILSRNNNPTEDGSVQTYTIQTSPNTPQDANTIIIQQKIRKIAKPPVKLQKIKPQNTIVKPLSEAKTAKETNTDDTMFDINSMPIVLSEDILTPESIEKMPIVMSDGNIITNSPNPPKLVKAKQTVAEPEKVAISPTPKPEVKKTLLMNPVTEVNKVTTPNILSKSSKLRGAKPMLVIDKTTGKQKIIMTKAEAPMKETVIKPAPQLIQSVPQNVGKADKFIILPTPSSPRPGRTQKILIDPQTGKAHVLVAKAPETQIVQPESKPVSAKLIPASTDANTPGNTVMIITNAQGAQSRIVLTPEHEKILFPNKQQPNVSQLKSITHRLTTNPVQAQKTVTSVAAVKSQTIGPAKTPTRIVPKQKSAIITSKGQLIVGGRVATTAQNIAPMPEIRPVPKRLISEPKKLLQTIQKAPSEPLIFLQQKSGAVTQLTAAQFEHLQRTGQIVQKPMPVPENKIVVQKSITLSPKDSVATPVPKSRMRKTVVESPLPLKKAKHDIAIAPAPVPSAPVPALTPLSNTGSTSLLQPITNTIPAVSQTTSYPELENFEELLPTTSIARQPEPVLPQQPEPAAPPLSDGQLLAVPGEHFGGPTGSFYLCVEENGTFTPIDNRPLVLENNQLVPMAVEPLPALATQPERRDILEAALANSDVFHADAPRDEAPDFRDLNANVSVHCRVSETSTTLNQPIMTPVEVPTKAEIEPAIPSNLEDGLAVIGVTPHTVPTSLELPITVTDPRIAPKTTDPLSGNNYGPTMLTSPNTEMTFATAEDIGVAMGPISMPLLTEEDSVGKSMPILTDDVTERTVSSVESTIGSPSSIDVRESENEDSGQWTRRLLTPGSDTSETSAEIPLQPAIQLSVNDLSHS